jgi:hypothetical protein
MRCLIHTGDGKSLTTKQRTDKNDSVKEFYTEFLRLPNPRARRAAKLPYATKQEFCTHWHIDRVTVWRWENDPEFMRKVHNDVLGLLTIDEAQRIINAQKIRAFDGNTVAAKFLLEWSGIVGPNASKPLGPDINEEIKTVSKMTDEELRSIIAEEDFAEIADVSEEVYDD